MASKACPTCGGTGRIPTAATVAYVDALINALRKSDELDLDVMKRIEKYIDLEEAMKPPSA